MKSWLALCTLAVAALGLGAVVMFGGVIGGPSRANTTAAAAVDPDAGDTCLPPLPPKDGPQPVVVVPEPSFNFDQMITESTDTHDFTIKNEGQYPLEIRLGEVTCKCTIGELEDGKIMPGKSTTVTLKWTISNKAGMFRQAATICTNDPKRRRVELSVSGQAMQPLRAIPPQAVFNGLSASMEGREQVQIFTAPGHKIELVGHTLEDPDLADHFEVTYERMDAEAIAANGAGDGWIVNVRVVPGLPLGPMRQKVILQTDHSNDQLKKLEIPIVGKITSEVTLHGSRWADKFNTLDIGTFKKGEGGEGALTLMIKGARQADIEVKVVSVDPEVLDVAIKERSTIAGATLTQIPIVIRVPEDCPSMNRLGQGQQKAAEVVLSTTHPDMPEIRIFVSFAVD